MDEDGNVLPRGRDRRGRASAGRNVTAGYENNPEANATAFADGWFRTGDQGIARRGGLPAPHRPAQGADQPRRREDLAARGRRGADGSSGGRAGRDLRHAARQARRGGRRRGGAARGSQRHRARAARLLRQRLADFKVPRKIVFLAEIPKGATGKLQRIGLAAEAGPRVGREDLHLRRRRHRRPARARSWPRGRRSRRRARAASRGDPRKAGCAFKRTATSGRSSPGHRHETELGVRTCHHRPEGAPGARRGGGRPGAVRTGDGGGHRAERHALVVLLRHGGPLEGTARSGRPGRASSRGLDPARVIGSIIYPAAEIVAPGVVRHVEGDRSRLGELDGSRTPSGCAPVEAPARGRLQGARSAAISAARSG